MNDHERFLLSKIAGLENSLARAWGEQDRLKIALRAHEHQGAQLAETRAVAGLAMAALRIASEELDALVADGLAHTDPDKARSLSETLQKLTARLESL